MRVAEPGQPLRLLLTGTAAAGACLRAQVELVAGGPSAVQRFTRQEALPARARCDPPMTLDGKGGRCVPLLRYHPTVWP